MIQFASPWLLLLLLGIPVLMVARYGNLRWRRPATLRYSNVQQIAFQGRSWRLMLQPLLPILRWLSLALLYSITYLSLRSLRRTMIQDDIEISMN